MQGIRPPWFVLSHAVTGTGDSECRYRVVTWKGHALKSTSNVVLIEFRYIRYWVSRVVVENFPICSLNEKCLSCATKFHAKCYISRVHSKLHGSAWISFLRKFVQFDVERTTRKVPTGISDGNYINGASWGALHHFWSNMRIASKNENYRFFNDWIRLTNLRQHCCCPFEHFTLFSM